MITLYGIPNCDTVKKARRWLSERGAETTFHDFKKQGVPTQEMDQWLRAVGWETLVNRKGTTWRKLEAAEREAVVDAASAKTLMLAHPSVIKRPVVRWADDAVTVGFQADTWAQKTPIS
jgi:arsenate reductase (glutaredoxin)